MQRQSTPQDELKASLLAALLQSLEDASSSSADGNSIEYSTRVLAKTFANRVDLLVDSAWDGDPAGAVEDFGRSYFENL